MNWYYYRRLRGALVLIMLGIVFLIAQSNLIRWSVAWPLFLIGLGVIMLAERLVAPSVPPPPPYPGAWPQQPGMPTSTSPITPSGSVVPPPPPPPINPGDSGSSGQNWR
jgi:hypothetical protein